MIEVNESHADMQRVETELPPFTKLATFSFLFQVLFLLSFFLEIKILLFEFLEQ